jgi:hypothetical protein
MAAESLETSLHAVVLSVKEYNREWKYHSRTERKEHGNIRRQQDQTSEWLFSLKNATNMTVLVVERTWEQ